MQRAKNKNGRRRREGKRTEGHASVGSAPAERQSREQAGQQVGVAGAEVREERDGAQEGNDVRLCEAVQDVAHAGEVGRFRVPVERLFAQDQQDRRLRRAHRAQLHRLPHEAAQGEGATR